MQPADTRTGNIFDLGYRTYDGLRLGRVHAISALYWYTLRSAFGFGRRTSTKIIPIIITIIAFLPAVAQLAIAALVSDDIDLITPGGYFGFVEVPIALFCAAVAPDIAGRDMRQRTLSLYFSHALRRRDYVLAKLGAFATALMLLTLAPQVVLVIGNGLATNDLGGYISDNWADIPRTFAAGVLIAVTAAAVCLAIAAQTPRRAYATIAVVSWFLVSFPVSQILVNGVGGAGRFAIFASPFEFFYGATTFIFNTTPEAGSPLDNSGFPLWSFLVAMLAYLAGGIVFVVRRFDRIPA